MSESADFISFKLPEEGRDFQQWLIRNRQGFVLNQLAAAKFMLHWASCHNMRQHPEPPILNPKHCSTDKTVLSRFAKAKSARLSNCKNCVP